MRENERESIEGKMWNGVRKRGINERVREQQNREKDRRKESFVQSVGDAACEQLHKKSLKKHFCFNKKFEGKKDFSFFFLVKHGYVLSIKVTSKHCTE